MTPLDQDTSFRMCTKCGTKKPIEQFHRSKDHIRGECRKCHNRKSKMCRKLRGLDPADYRWWKKKGLKEKDQRKTPEFRSRWILADSRKSDKRKGFENNLTKDFIESLIKDGCLYCGEKNLLMTLDRIDNFKGHTKENVKPACFRCNYLRRDMPYTAWIMMTPIIRQIRERGLFGDWKGK